MDQGDEHMTVTDWKDPDQVAEEVIRCALIEDRALEDAATGALGNNGLTMASCDVNARENLVVAGIPFAAKAFHMLSDRVSVEILTEEGQKVPSGTTLAVIYGRVSDILRGERIFLNLLGRMCGIATLTSEYVSLVRKYGTEILDTRKTTPCLRGLEKYSVKAGGGVNHRFSLADMAMIKDNHIAAAGGVENLGPVMNRLKSQGIPVEIEVDSLSQLRVVLPLAPHRILLDNMDTDTLREAVKISGDSGVYLEASGGINLKTVAAVAATGVNGISSGALTHSAESSDIGMDWSYHGGENNGQACF